MDEFNKLISISDDLRDVSWENQLLKILPSLKVDVLSEDPQIGPDGWPYLFVETLPTSTEPLLKVLHWLAERGIGLALNPNKDYPDYILTYGMIWDFKKNNIFEPIVAQVPAQESLLIRADQKVQIKKITEDLIPFFARKIIKEFLRDQGVYSPKSLFVSFDGGQRFELAMSLESLGSPPGEELPGILEALSWFLPQGLPVTLLKEANFPQFELL